MLPLELISDLQRNQESCFNHRQ